MDRLAVMETFVCVVETGSFSAAARRLRVGQPAVSKAIAQLEDHLGVHLLLRSTRGLTPTEAGQNFFEGARRAIAEAEEAELAARGASASLSGRLRICAAVTFARLHILPHLKKFLQEHPGLNIDVVLDDRQIDLLEEGIDVALRMGSLNDSTMTARKIGEGKRVLVGTPAYFATAGVPQTPEDLRQHQFVVYDRGAMATASTFRREGKEVSIDVTEGRIRVNAAEGVRAAVLAGMGVAIATDWMFSPELASGEVVRVLSDWDLPSIDLWAVYPSGRMANAKARAFTSFVQATMENYAAALA
ncbi:LysR family transcriptional regulator [Undibacterium terreum]|uniref:LysR family transcriptional regulator n=1 Tax=Undibacterium terreum TaxID=1224302 RepID=A0A916UPK4_9BURK|nr:LysR family transcriptional regulator [Undibacterium terreum]GGC78753.1 LysR family transcriptional regulator [Undibacterium terreum]